MSKYHFNTQNCTPPIKISSFPPFSVQLLIVHQWGISSRLENPGLCFKSNAAVYKSIFFICGINVAESSSGCFSVFNMYLDNVKRYLFSFFFISVAMFGQTKRSLISFFSIDNIHKWKSSCLNTHLLRLGKINGLVFPVMMSRCNISSFNGIEELYEF